MPKYVSIKKVRLNKKGDCCGSVGRVVASYIRDRLFESSHQQKCFGINCFRKTVLRETKIKKKRPGMIKQKMLCHLVLML